MGPYLLPVMLVMLIHAPMLYPVVPGAFWGRGDVSIWPVQAAGIRLKHSRSVRSSPCILQELEHITDTAFVRPNHMLASCCGGTRIGGRGRGGVGWVPVGPIVTATQSAKPHARCVTLTPVEEACGYVETLTKLAGRKRRHVCASCACDPDVIAHRCARAGVWREGARHCAALQDCSAITACNGGACCEAVEVPEACNRGDVQPSVMRHHASDVPASPAGKVVQIRGCEAWTQTEAHLQVHRRRLRYSPHLPAADSCLLKQLAPPGCRWLCLCSGLGPG